MGGNRKKDGGPGKLDYTKLVRCQQLRKRYLCSFVSTDILKKRCPYCGLQLTPNKQILCLVYGA